ncbi:MAG: AAA family ATPase [Magnetococcales bacterium]|nr:AAA family ATPase [Magnetococcales bacterium]
MIKQLTMENWKSFSKATLYIDPLGVLIGTNASGKSNALDAFLFLNCIANGISLTEALAGNANLSGLRGGVEWATLIGREFFSLSVAVSFDLIKTDFIYSVKASVNGSQCEIREESLKRLKYRPSNLGGKPYEVFLFRTEECSVDSPIITVRLYNEKRGTPRQSNRTHTILSQLAQQSVRKEIQEGIDIVLRNTRNIFVLDPIPANMRDYCPLSDQLMPDASNIAGTIAALSDEKRNEIESAVQNYVRHLPERDIQRIWAEKVGRFATDAILYCEEHWSENPNALVQTVDSRGMSDGTLRFLAILTALLTRPSGSLLIIEEVDNGLHPSRAHLLVRMLRELGVKRGVDVLVTTHNPALLDALGPEMTPFVTVSHRDSDSGHSCLTLLEDVQQLPKLLAMGSIGRLSTSGRLEQALSARNGE